MAVAQIERGPFMNGVVSSARVAVVVPAFEAEGTIATVIAGIGDAAEAIVVVDDGSSDGTARVVEGVAALDRRVVLIRHDRNQGVGAAMITGFRAALGFDVDVVVKMDADGQMDPAELGRLVAPIAGGVADYAKGNRFFVPEALDAMPAGRRFGNLCLSFLAKAATGYWNLFDPTNGYVAIRVDVLREVLRGEIDCSYFFETSMLARLYMLRAVVRDVPMPARYGAERSHLSVVGAGVRFPGKLLRLLSSRIAKRYFVYDFNIASLYMLVGAPCALFGVIFGASKWYSYGSSGVAAPTGTIMLAVLPFVIGFEMLIAAIAVDLQGVPSEPLWKSLSRDGESSEF